MNENTTEQILLDLIAELRERQDRLRRKSGYPSELVQDYDFAMGDIADRAAARLGKESP